MNTPIRQLLYLHGFRSSPQSAKARLVAAWMRQHAPDTVWLCPQLPPSPAQAMQQIAEQTADWDAASTAVIGSSLGGFYAAALAAQRGWRSVLLNPAVDPARDLAAYIGTHPVWHDPAEHIHFRPEYVDELRAIGARSLADRQRLLQQGRHPAAYALICQGDEVLNWEEMRAGHPQAHQRILPGNNHAIDDFEQHWPEIARWLGPGVA